MNFIATRHPKMIDENGTRPRSERVKFASRLLQKIMLPHINVDFGPNSNCKKAFYLGYMVHKLLNCSLNRNEQEDRDHISNKRMDLAGPMIGRLFHGLLYRFTKVGMGFGCQLGTAQSHEEGGQQSEGKLLHQHHDQRQGSSGAGRLTSSPASFRTVSSIRSPRGIGAIALAECPPRRAFPSR